uniref:ribosomal maturation YjgA family protein n=1 Tax=Gelidibacter sp. TaxID=2018083 RepID=UPI00404ADB2E
MKHLTFNKTYFFTFLILLATEILIAVYLKSGFIRHTFGDFLVVILMYCFVKSFILIKPIYLAVGVLVFSFFIEFLQLFNVLKLIGLEQNSLANIILGSTFHLSDLLAYTLGTITILIIDLKFSTKWNLSKP